MPNIDGKKFPYTQAGKKAAAAYKKKIKPLKKAAAAPSSTRRAYVGKFKGNGRST